MLRLIHRIRTGSAAAAALLLAAGCASLGGVREPQAAPPEMDVGTRVQAEGKYVVIDLDVNELHFMHGERVLWSAPVGTGTGFRLKSDKTEWEFLTPNGMFHVQFKEQNPAWVAPDWYFIENKLPVPPEDSPQRKLPNGLGSAAVYLGHEIAIHGTDKPELLGKRVSHGCIRLSNANALRLFHNVQVGTPVVIRGGPKEALGEMPDSAANFLRPKKGPPPKRYVNPFARVPTTRLLARLDTELAEGDTTWVLVASELIGRGLKDDAIALRGVLARAGKGASDSVDAEYATFLADAFSRGALRVVVSLARISEEARERAVQAIVSATMALYHGPPESSTAPWPTRRVPKGRLGPSGQSGWVALQAAEARYREEFSGAAPVRVAR